MKYRAITLGYDTYYNRRPKTERPKMTRNTTKKQAKKMGLYTPLSAKTIYHVEE